MPKTESAAPVLLEPALVVEHTEDFIVLERASGDHVALRYWTVPAWVADGDVVLLAVELAPASLGNVKHSGPRPQIEAKLWVVDSPARSVVMTREGYEAA